MEISRMSCINFKIPNITTLGKQDTGRRQTKQNIEK